MAIAIILGLGIAAFVATKAFLWLLPLAIFVALVKTVWPRERVVRIPADPAWLDKAKPVTSIMHEPRAANDG